MNLRGWISGQRMAKFRPTAPDPNALPSYPTLAAPEPPDVRISREIARLEHYREAYGIEPAEALGLWRQGLSVDAVIERIKKKAGGPP